MVALTPEGVLYGNPPRSAHAPERDDFLAWMRATESLAGSGSLTSFNETLAVLQARPAVADGKFALVISDAEEAGVYERVAGDWQKVAGLPAIFTESLAAVRAEAARDLAQTYAAAANASRQEAAEIVGFDPTLSLSKRTDVPGWNVGGLPFIFASGANEDSYHHDDSTNSHIFRSDATTGDLDDLGSSRVKAAFADFREWRHAEGLKVGQLSGVYGISIGTDANGRENSGRLFFESTTSNWAIVNWDGDLGFASGGLYGSVTGPTVIRLHADGAISATRVTGAWVATNSEAKAGTNNDQVMTPLRTANSIAANQAVRAWVNFDGTGTPTIRASHNVTSITDNGAGDYSVNFVTNMPHSNYAPLITHQETISGRGFTRLVSRTASAYRFVTTAGDGNPIDVPNISVAFLA